MLEEREKDVPEFSGYNFDPLAPSNRTEIKNTAYTDDSEEDEKFGLASRPFTAGMPSSLSSPTSGI
jgi:hypothetical protein